MDNLIWFDCLIKTELSEIRNAHYIASAMKAISCLDHRD